MAIDAEWGQQSGWGVSSVSSLATISNPSVSTIILNPFSEREQRAESREREREKQNQNGGGGGGGNRCLAVKGTETPYQLANTF